MVDSDIMYSTEYGDLRKKKTRKSDVKPLPSGIKNDGIIRIRRETKGRGGKTVSVIYGLSLDTIELKNFAKKLKKSCGTGGTVGAGLIVMQGDVVEQLTKLIKTEGYRVKSVG